MSSFCLSFPLSSLWCQLIALIWIDLIEISFLFITFQHSIQCKFKLIWIVENDRSPNKMRLWCEKMGRESFRPYRIFVCFVEFLVMAANANAETHLLLWCPIKTIKILLKAKRVKLFIILGAVQPRGLLHELLKGPFKRNTFTTFPSKFMRHFNIAHLMFNRRRKMRHYNTNSLRSYE